HIASFNAFSKSRAKDILEEIDVLMPDMITVSKDQIDSLGLLTEGMPYPCIVKPNSSGSSYGVSKVNSSSDLFQAVDMAFEYNDLILIEQFVAGIELSCGVIEYDNRIQALPVTEIVFDGEIFDYELKYADGGAKEITPARISDSATKNCQRISEKVFKQLDLKDMARVDFILQKEPQAGDTIARQCDEIFFIECNTIPGLSRNSILPKQLKSAGIEMKDFFTEMVERSACRD
ncbi:MAG: ATP-grasp domain-containing protein, partial [Bacteroidetes bacterium]|nr:ATP-grasp domain-containing protein [Bacteroidota bacterium]